MLLQTNPATGPETGSKSQPPEERATIHPKENDSHATHMLDYAPAPGWTIHVTKEGRLYYCK